MGWPGSPDSNHGINEYAHHCDLQSRKRLPDPSKIDTVT